MQNFNKTLIYKNKREILNNILADAGFLYSTNLDLITVCPAPDFIKNGLYHMNGLESDADIDSFPDLAKLVTSPDYLPLFELTKSEIAIFLGNASKDQTRLHLNSIYFDVENSRVTSTSGYSLFSKNVTTSYAADSLLIPIELVKKVKTARKVAFSYSPTTNYICATLPDDTCVFARPIRREFVKYLHIIPKAVKGNYAEISPDLIEKIRMAFKADKMAKVVFNEGVTTIVSEKFGTIFSETSKYVGPKTAFATEKLLNAIGGRKEFLTLAITGELTPAYIEQVGTMTIVMPLKF